ncbi:LacI family transcriptional regulator [Rathayibacter sp. PhB93]|uniref:LacI family DNA-binding transcriptional regulator n=1 Tax=unclassified Rathayibacter TaxID=2609250 RepID=UPI000F46118A|nr:MULTISPECIES: LacI family DNA-binding transcriptional regulator [unclassified Rathayibacter]ROQ00936.1 LacI family transcriptional regulator [Rathayibacter sp. PhB93]TDQ07290.1 LacI family transcriptional regulator [Rathayibacter sp. PhB1]
MPTTSRDVALYAGVSRSTVSEILNGRGAKFAAATREKVERAVQELKYQPSAAARSLVRGTSDLVIALIPDTTFGVNLQDILEKATEELAGHGLTLLLRFSTPSSEMFDRMITTASPRGVLSFMPFSMMEQEIMRARGVQFIASSPLDSHSGANVDIGRLQVRHLSERGHRRIAFARLRDTRQDVFGDERESGVRDECQELGLPEPAIVKLGVDRDEALAVVDSLAGMPIAVACYNDDVAAALVSAATIRGRRIPEDFAVIGMDNTPVGQVMVPRLSTIDYPASEAAHLTVAGFLSAITGEVIEASALHLALRIIAGETS